MGYVFSNIDQRIIESPMAKVQHSRLVAEFFHGLGIDHLMMIYGRDIHKVVHHNDVCCCITPLTIIIGVTCILHQA